MPGSGRSRSSDPWRALARGGWLRLAPLAALLFVVSVWPLAMLVVGSLRTAPPGFAGDWSLAAWLSTYDSPGTARAIGSAFVISLVSTAGSTLLAAALAFLAERTDVPLRRCITPALLLVFATPALFYAMGYGFLGNPYTGQLNAAASALLGLDHPLFDIETWPGFVTVMTLKKTAVIYLFLIGPFRALDPAHDDASLIAGASHFETFWRIALPALAPALTVAVLLGIVGGLQAYDMVLVLGGPIGLDVISTRIMGYINGSVPPDYARASVLSIGVVAVLGVLCLLQTRLLGRRGYVTVGGKRGGHRRIALRASRWPLAAGVALVLAGAALLPIGSVVYSSLQPFPGVYGRLSLDHYREVLALPRVLDAIRVTFTLAIVVGLVAMSLAVVVAQAGRGLRGWRASGLRFLTLVPLAMPGVVTALAILWGFVSLPLLKQLYGSLWLLIAALVVCALPIAIQVANAAIVQIAPELQEAARIAGASAGRALFDVVVRLLAPAFLAGWFMVAIMVSGNMEVPMLLKAPGLAPIAVVVYNINAAGDFSGAAALLVLLLLVKIALWAFGLAGLRAGRALVAWRERRLLHQVRRWHAAPAAGAVPSDRAVALLAKGYGS